MKDNKDTVPSPFENPDLSEDLRSRLARVFISASEVDNNIILEYFMEPALTLTISEELILEWEDALFIII